MNLISIHRLTGAGIKNARNQINQMEADMAKQPLPTEQEQRAAIDRIVSGAANLALENTGASLGMLLDRLLTFSAAHAVGVDGPVNTAAAFRHIADQIDAGVFDHLEGKTAVQSKKH